MNSDKPDNLMNEARLLMPWYLTGQLSAEEQELVNKALEQFTELRQELLNEKKMMRLVKENSSLLELNALDTTEQRLANTLARIDQEAMHPTVAGDHNLPEKNHQTGRKSSARWLDKLFSTPLLNFNGLSPANAVLATLLMFQVGVLGYMHISKPESQVQYTSASVQSINTATEQQKQKTLLFIEFEKDTRYGAICDFLNERGARIVDGPDSMNVFSVEMSTDTPANANKLVETIRQQAAQANVPVAFIGLEFQN